MMNKFFRSLAGALVAAFVSLTAAHAATTDGTVLKVVALDGSSQTFTMDDLKKMPVTTIVTETVWTEPGKKVAFKGVLLRDLLSKIGKTTPATLHFIAGNDYAADVPADDATKFDVVLAYEQDGKSLDPADKGPLWVMYPYSDRPELNDKSVAKVYLSRAVWQVNEIDYQ